MECLKKVIAINVLERSQLFVNFIYIYPPYYVHKGYEIPCIKKHEVMNKLRTRESIN